MKYVLVDKYNNIVNQRPELLETIKILDDTKKLYTLTEFMDILSKLKVITYSFNYAGEVQ